MQGNTGEPLQAGLRPDGARVEPGRRDRLKELFQGFRSNTSLMHAVSNKNIVLKQPAQESHRHGKAWILALRDAGLSNG